MSGILISVALGFVLGMRFSLGVWFAGALAVTGSAIFGLSNIGEMAWAAAFRVVAYNLGLAGGLLASRYLPRL